MVQRREATLRWKDIRGSLQERPSDKLVRGFYCIWTMDSRGTSKILYIGKAWEQSVWKRVQQPHDVYDDYPLDSLLLKIGTVEEQSLGHMTEEFFSDIECCLIYTHKPEYNEICKEKSPLRPVSIVNTGDVRPLKEKCRYPSSLAELLLGRR